MLARVVSLLVFFPGVQSFTRSLFPPVLFFCNCVEKSLRTFCDSCWKFHTMTCNSRSLLPIGSHARRVMTLAYLEMNKYTTTVSLHRWLTATAENGMLTHLIVFFFWPLVLLISQPVFVLFLFFRELTSAGERLKSSTQIDENRSGGRRASSWSGFVFRVSFISRGPSTALFQSAVRNKVIRGSIKKYDTKVGASAIYHIWGSLVSDQA